MHKEHVAKIGKVFLSVKPLNAFFNSFIFSFISEQDLGGALNYKKVIVGEVPEQSKKVIPGINGGLLYMTAGTTSSNGNFYHITAGGTVTKLAGDNNSISIVKEDGVIKYVNNYNQRAYNVYCIYIW